MRVVFVHGACVRDGAWWWHRAAEELAAGGPGWAGEAALLPSCGETGGVPGEGGPSLAEDVASVRALLTAREEPTVVVAHSYGGVVVTAAAAGLEHVAHLLYIAAFLPEVGESLASAGDGSPAPALEVRPDGTFGVRPERVVETFLHDCDPALHAPAQERLVWQSASVTVAPVGAAAWQDLPSTYLVCAGDRGTRPAVQRGQAARAGRTVEVDAGHHVFLSQPGAVAELVRGLG
jgi:pimeloyl-ACP methyl ester carboxylesterase